MATLSRGVTHSTVVTAMPKTSSMTCSRSLAPTVLFTPCVWMVGSSPGETPTRVVQCDAQRKCSRKEEDKWWELLHGSLGFHHIHLYIQPVQNLNVVYQPLVTLVYEIMKHVTAMWMVLWYFSLCISILQTFTIAGNPPSTPGMLDWGRWLLRWSEKPDIAVWTVVMHRAKGWWINKLLIVFRCFHSSQELTFRFNGWWWAFFISDQIPNYDRSMSRRCTVHGRWIFIRLFLHDQDQWRAINAFDHVWDGCQSCHHHHHHRRRRRRRRRRHHHHHHHHHHHRHHHHGLLPFWFKDFDT